MLINKNINPDWYLKYLGKPWEANPNPPESYNCGELVRAIHRDLFGIDSPAIPIDDARSRKQCLEAMQPNIFGLLPLGKNENHREFDVAFLGRRIRLAHCGVAVNTQDGIKILHCPEAACGVCLDNFIELKLMGFPEIRWFRHRDLF